MEVTVKAKPMPAAVMDSLLLFTTEPKTATQKPPEGDPQWIPPSGSFIRCTKCKGLEDVIRNIYILRDVAELISHIALVDGDVLVRKIRRFKGEIF